MQGIFNGIRVLDFSQVLAGPTATRLLVELGAEVIKIEFAEQGDPGRTLPRLDGSRSGYHVQQNRGKRSLCLDLSDPRATELVLDLVPHTDVSFRTSRLASWNGLVSGTTLCQRSTPAS